MWPSSKKKCLRLQAELSDTVGKIERSNFRMDNFDTVAAERDSLKKQVADINQSLTYTDAELRARTTERDELARDLADVRRQSEMLRMDKGYLTKESDMLASRCNRMEAEIARLNTVLHDAVRQREEMHERLAVVRDGSRAEYESRLEEEIAKMREETNKELAELRGNAKDLFERENRGLREARDIAVAEMERAKGSEREATQRCDRLMDEFRQLQATSDSKIVELNGELKMKAFEHERLRLLHEEAAAQLRQAKLEIDRLGKKTEILTKEFYTLQSQSDKKIAEIESQLGEKNSKLHNYESLEKELDDVIMHAAEVEGDIDSEQLLLSYGYSLNVAGNAKRRLQQSVQLARRVLSQQREITRLKKDLDKEQSKVKTLGEQVAETNAILDSTQQPYNYLVDTIRARDKDIRACREHIELLEEEVK
eukprot:Opistho-2@68351